jgi:hypothetical protein
MQQRHLKKHRKELWKIDRPKAAIAKDPGPYKERINNILIISINVCFLKKRLISGAREGSLWPWKGKLIS